MSLNVNETHEEENAEERHKPDTMAVNEGSFCAVFDAKRTKYLFSTRRSEGTFTVR